MLGRVVMWRCSLWNSVLWHKIWLSAASLSYKDSSCARLHLHKTINTVLEQSPGKLLTFDTIASCSNGSCSPWQILGIKACVAVLFTGAACGLWPSCTWWKVSGKSFVRNIASVIRQNRVDLDGSFVLFCKRMVAFLSWATLVSLCCGKWGGLSPAL